MGGSAVSPCGPHHGGRMYIPILVIVIVLVIVLLLILR